MVVTGLAVSLEQGTDATFTCALVHLDTKTLEILNFEVSAVTDVATNWALNKYQSGCKYPGVDKLDSNAIKHRIATIFEGVGVYFVRNKQTLDVLVTIFGISKTKIYVINKSLNDNYGLRCVSCGEHTQNCAVFDVIAITNFICNQNKDSLPKDLEIADAGTCFKFDALRISYKTYYTIKSANEEKCERATTHLDETSDDSSDNECE
jgi:hypothetical protein